jgi:hypothetical protein
MRLESDERQYINAFEENTRRGFKTIEEIE